MVGDKVKRYRDKRASGRSPEPTGRYAPRESGVAPVFVIQKHDASTLHYDFRLEIDGVLKSWAVPKGPSTDPHDKRLAIETEGHPLDYADFEGVIPAGEYGGGTVLVWDRGTFSSLEVDADGRATKTLLQACEDGHLSVWLEGRKIRGGYSLIHFRSEDYKRLWLLVKMDDVAADARRNPVQTEPESVLSGRTLEQIALGGVTP